MQPAHVYFYITQGPQGMACPIFGKGLTALPAASKICQCCGCKSCIDCDWMLCKPSLAMALKMDHHQKYRMGLDHCKIANL